MKRNGVLGILFAAAISLGCLTACGAPAGSGTEESSAGGAVVTGKMEIVATAFPEYDWVRTVAGDDGQYADVTLLLDNGVDIHSYQPTAEDMMKISTCDVFLYGGGQSEEWIDEALENSQNKDQVVINLMDVLGDSVKEEAVIDGMEAEEEGHDHEVEYDEHVWLSLKNAQTYTNVIAEKLGEVDPDNAAVYTANAASYCEKLSALDGRYQAAVDASGKKALLFGDRFPFRYLTDDYGITYYAAFPGCSAETEASFETIIFLADKVDDLGLDYVMTIDGSDQKIAETIIRSTKENDQEILTLDSIQSVSAADIENGTTYLSIMTQNLETLEKVLS